MLKFVRHFRFVPALVALIALAASSAYAAKPTQVSPTDRILLDKITSYINGIRNLEGDFTQISPKGKVSTGKFYISKPGKLRFEYAPPNPFLIVSDGTWLSVNNRAHNKSDQYPLSKTPLRLMLSDQVDLSKQAIVRQIQNNDGIITVALEDRDQLVSGHLILVFNDNTKALQQWVVVDAQGRRTTVSLDNTVIGTKPDPRLFKIKRIDRNKSKTDR
jgi:outer membrane lipoprotein-sorting protein